MASEHFGVSLKQLRELMEFRGAEGIQKLNEIGGLQELLNALNTSEEIGKATQSSKIRKKVQFCEAALSSCLKGCN